MDTYTKKNALAQSILLAIEHNINKLHHKIQSERAGTHFYKLKKNSITVSSELICRSDTVITESLSVIKIDASA